MKTFISNLKRAIQNRESVTIGGGQFSPDELRAVLSALENGRKTNSELLERAYGIAESQFYSDDECEIPWQPFEDYDKEEIQDQVHDLAQTILQAMLWSQENDD